MIVEGYAEYATWRPHLAYLRDPYGDPDMEMEIDGVGGCQHSGQGTSVPVWGPLSRIQLREARPRRRASAR